MLITREISPTGDPSENNQRFKSLDINVLCCRYWWFEIWKGKKMSFPYWRLYWNKNEGAYVYFKRKQLLTPDRIYLIPPNTPFENGITNQKLKGNPSYFFKCGKVQSKQEEQAHINSGNILHFFVHFTLGMDFDGVAPGIYEIPLDDKKESLIEEILDIQLQGKSDFNQMHSLALYFIILTSVSELPKAVWQFGKIDNKVRDVLTFMERNIHNKITVHDIANSMKMGTSALVRMFKGQMRLSPSKYLLELRLRNACDMLLHTDLTIEGIAQNCGFYDRYHMTRLFSKRYGTSPAAFRKKSDYY